MTIWRTTMGINKAEIQISRSWYSIVPTNKQRCPVLNVQVRAGLYGICWRRLPVTRLRDIFASRNCT